MAAKMPPPKRAKTRSAVKRTFLLLEPVSPAGCIPLELEAARATDVLGLQITLCCTEGVHCQAVSKAAGVQLLAPKRPNRCRIERSALGPGRVNDDFSQWNFARPKAQSDCCCNITIKTKCAAACANLSYTRFLDAAKVRKRLGCVGKLRWVGKQR